MDSQGFLPGLRMPQDAASFSLTVDPFYRGIIGHFPDYGTFLGAYSQINPFVSASFFCFVISVFSFLALSSTGNWSWFIPG